MPTLGSVFGAGGVSAVPSDDHLASAGEPHWHVDDPLEIAHPVEVWFTTAAGSWSIMVNSWSSAAILCSD